MSSNKPILSTLILAMLFLCNTAFAEKEASVQARINRVIKKAESYMGTPHKMGGLTKKGIDCSALMMVSFAAGNINLPRTSRQQATVGKRVMKKDLRRGDLIFFKINGVKISHTGLITKVSGSDVEFIHTSSSRGVMISNLNQSYWTKRYTSARRVWDTRRREKGKERPIASKKPKPEQAPRINSSSSSSSNVNAGGSPTSLGKFPQASRRDIKKKYLKRMSVNNLTLMSMEIYARNGYIFPTPKAQSYFENLAWYRAIEDKTRKRGKIKRRLSPIEKSNLRKIESIRKKKEGK